MFSRLHRCTGFAIWTIVVAGLSAPAEAVPWLLYADASSDSVCDVVNAANLEFVVLDVSGELVSVTGTDLAYVDTFVDEDGLVFFRGEPAGVIEFAEDGDGFRTLWWLVGFGEVADVNEFTGEPTSSGLQPTSFVGVPCDACPFWDDPAECTDSDLDGVEDLLDLCPHTPFDEAVDDDGCSCSQNDSDLDGIDDCFDLCPHTPLDEVADATGCSCSDLDSDLDGVDDCTDLCPETPFDFISDFDGCACEEVDGDFDGVNGCFDLCPDTPRDEFPDVDGCSCSQVDDDLDGVSDCFDLCPGTPFAAIVDIDGCLLDTGGPTGPVINVCGSFSAMIFPMMLFGLASARLSFSRQRR